MKHDYPEKDFLQQFFQNQRKEEQASSPTFSSVYGRAQIQYRKMRRIKLVIGVAIGLLLLTGLAILTQSETKGQENIKVAKAGISLYDLLMDDGKIVTNDIQFEFDKATMKPGSMAIIKSIAEMMKTHPEVRLRIEGHTDSRGSSSYNRQLSSVRAAAVKQALVNLSIDSNRLTAKGYGEAKPAADNSTEAGRVRNRRVEFVSF